MFTDDWDYLDSNKKLLAFVRPEYSKYRIFLVEHGWFPQGLYKTLAEAKAVVVALVAML